MSNDQMTVEEYRRKMNLPPVGTNSRKGVSFTDETKMKKSKYSAVRTVVDNIKFMSKREAEYYKKLKLLKDCGEIMLLELQPRFPYKIIYTHPDKISPIFSKKGEYRADFKVTYESGIVEVIDVKGFSTKKFLRDKEIIKAIYGIDIITV